METLTEQEERICREADSYFKTLLKNEARDIYRKDKYQAKYEDYLSALIEQNEELFAVYDEYETDCVHFFVNGYDAIIRGDALAKALSDLTDLNRSIVLLNHYFEMTDEEIAQILRLTRSTVQRKRSNTLYKLRRILEETQ